jgi:hypothetical protein
MKSKSACETYAAKYTSLNCVWDSRYGNDSSTSIYGGVCKEGPSAKWCSSKAAHDNLFVSSIFPKAGQVIFLDGELEIGDTSQVNSQYKGAKLAVWNRDGTAIYGESHVSEVDLIILVWLLMVLIRTLDYML